MAEADNTGTLLTRKSQGRGVSTEGIMLTAILYNTYVNCNSLLFAIYWDHSAALIFLGTQKPCCHSTWKSQLTTTL